MILSIMPTVLTVVIAHFLALLSPGPDFMLLIKSGLKNEVRNAMGLALGIASANGLYIGLCIIGIGEILSYSLMLLRFLKLAGGIFLLYIAVSALIAKKESYILSLESEDISRDKKHYITEFSTGFISGITNPKNLIFYLSLFSMVLTGGVGSAMKIGLGIWMTCLVFVWDSMILFFLSRESIRNKFTKIAFYIDKIAGLVIGVFGVKIIIMVVKESLV